MAREVQDNKQQKYDEGDSPKHLYPTGCVSRRSLIGSHKNSSNSRTTRSLSTALSSRIRPMGGDVRYEIRGLNLRQRTGQPNCPVRDNPVDLSRDSEEDDNGEKTDRPT